MLYSVKYVLQWLIEPEILRIKQSKNKNYDLYTL